MNYNGLFMPTNFLAGYELAVPVSPAAPAWRAAPWRDINDWVHLADGVNDAACFTAALAATDFLMVTPKSGGGTWTMPFTASSNSGGGAVTIPSGKAIKGLNKHAKIHCTGGDVSSPNSPSVFDVWGLKFDIIFEDLWFYGDNGTTPGTFTYSLNKQSAVIFQHGNDASETCSDITVRGCTFEYLYGFPVHHLGGSVTQTNRCHVINCTVRYCANGLNMNSNHSLLFGNVVLHSEGFETTGVGTVTVNNIIREGLGNCIAQGGAGTVQPGQVVANNYCYPDQTVGGEALALGDGFIDSVVSGNTIISVTGSNYGMDFRNAFGATYQPKRNIIANNIIRHDVSSAPAIHATSANSIYLGNVVTGNANVALQIVADDCTFVGNKLDVGSSVARSFQTGGSPLNILIDQSNQYAPFAWFDGSTGTATFRDGSFLRLTALPAAALYLRGVEVSVRGGAGVADVRTLGIKDAGDAAAWSTLI